MGTIRVFKRVRSVKSNGFQQIHGLSKIFLCFSGEADNDIGTDGDIRAIGSQFRDFFQIYLSGVFPVHFFQHSIRAGLHRQMELRAEIGKIAKALHQFRGEILRIRGGEAESLHSGYLGNHFEQIGKAGRIFGNGIGAAIGIDILAQQR